MRIVNFNYLQQVYLLLKNDGVMLSSKRLRRFAYLDVHLNNYKSFEMYNYYRKVVNSDASYNQTIAIVLVVSLLIAASVFIFFS